MKRTIPTVWGIIIIVLAAAIVYFAYQANFWKEVAAGKKPMPAGFLTGTAPPKEVMEATGGETQPQAELVSQYPRKKGAAAEPAPAPPAGHGGPGSPGIATSPPEEVRKLTGPKAPTQGPAPAQPVTPAPR